MRIDGRLMLPHEFLEHVRGLDLADVRRLCVHHTYLPNEAQWRASGGWSYRKGQMAAYYGAKGWVVGPHLFGAPEGICLFSDLRYTGRAVGGGGLEQGTRHLEMVGDFRERRPAGPVLEHSLDALGAILTVRGLGIDAVTNHRDYTRGGSECPGAALLAGWDWFLGLLEARRQAIQQVLGRAAVVPAREHVVVSGDTLWGIARKVYGDGARWTELARLNHLEAPYLLRVGQRVRY